MKVTSFDRTACREVEKAATELGRDVSESEAWAWRSKNRQDTSVAR